MNEVKGFFGLFRFLSNFHECPVTFAGMEFKSTEHAYQAAKTFDMNERLAIQACPLPRDAKKLSHKLTLRPDWEQVKYDIMLGLTRRKYVKGSELWEALQATGDAYLEETNTWHDNCWGCCTCLKCKDVLGQNWLGNLLMQVREETRA